MQENLSTPETRETRLQSPFIYDGTKHAYELLHGREAAEGKAGFYAQINLDTGCSYNCPKCALADCPAAKCSHKDRQDLPIISSPSEKSETSEPIEQAEIDRLIKQLAELGTKTLVIIGYGEPSENFDDETTKFPDYKHRIKPVIETAHESGLKTILFTNASNINEEQAIFYRDHGVSLFVSLDSLDPHPL